MLVRPVHVLLNRVCIYIHCVSLYVYLFIDCNLESFLFPSCSPPFFKKKHIPPCVLSLYFYMNCEDTNWTSSSYIFFVCLLVLYMYVDRLLALFFNQSFSYQYMLTKCFQSIALNAICNNNIWLHIHLATIVNNTSSRLRQSDNRN